MPGRRARRYDSVRYALGYQSAVVGTGMLSFITLGDSSAGVRIPPPTVAASARASSPQLAEAGSRQLRAARHSHSGCRLCHRATPRRLRRPRSPPPPPRLQLRRRKARPRGRAATPRLLPRLGLRGEGTEAKRLARASCPARNPHMTAAPDKHGFDYAAQGAARPSHWHADWPAGT